MMQGLRMLLAPSAGASLRQGCRHGIATCRRRVGGARPSAKTVLGAAPRHAWAGGAAGSPAAGASAPGAATPGGMGARALGAFLAAAGAVAAAAAAATAAGEGIACEPAAPRGGATPTDKLACGRPAGGFGAAPSPYRPVVLLACGSFNPPTVMHLRMFEVAKDDLRRRGFDVIGAYISPVHDGYGKPGLAPASDRVRMCQLATADSPMVMVDSWEASQSGYSRTLVVLEHVEAAMAGMRGPGGESVRVMLLCGADLLHSFVAPGVWRPEHVAEIAGERHGVVCVARPGAGGDVEELMAESPVLSACRGNVLVVRDDVSNDTSSTKVRKKVREGLSVRYLVDDDVARYIKERGLYKS